MESGEARRNHGCWLLSHPNMRGVAARDLADDLVGAPAAGGQHLLDRRVAWRYLRQAVGPAGAVVGLDEFPEILSRTQGITMIAFGPHPHERAQAPLDDPRLPPRGLPHAGERRLRRARALCRHGL